MDRNAREATEAERRRIEQPEGIARPDGASWIATSTDALAWVAPSDSTRTYSEGALRARWRSGGSAICGAPACRGDFMGLWWDRAGDALWFLRREGWGKRELALYSWTADQTAPVRIIATRDQLLGCQRARDRLMCVIEQSTRSRRIVSIDPSRGVMKEIFDPNPEFRNLRLGHVERLQWTNVRGIEVYGDLVLPPGPTSDKRLPLVTSSTEPADSCAVVPATSSRSARIRAPLLLQSAADEYLMSLKTFTAFKEARKPVELIVFPGEHHTKWQPRHRLAIYRRNLAWFGFWLKEGAGVSATATDIGRWKAMRAAGRTTNDRPPKIAEPPPRRDGSSAQ